MMDVMVDLETLGLKFNSKILSIGACRYDINVLSSREDLAKDSFYVNIDVGSYNIADGLFTETQSTLQFWQEQPVEAKQVLETNKVAWWDAMDSFLKWKGKDKMKVWANDPTFDLEKLDYHATVCGLSQDLWAFWEKRDFRTLKDIAEAKSSSVYHRSTEGIKHFALDDAINQAYDTQRYWAQLMGREIEKPSREFTDSSITGARW